MVLICGSLPKPLLVLLLCVHVFLSLVFLLFFFLNNKDIFVTLGLVENDASGALVFCGGLFYPVESFQKPG